jgi:hypothetical protein
VSPIGESCEGFTTRTRNGIIQGIDDLEQFPDIKGKIVIILLPGRFMMIRIINTAAFFIISRNFAIHSDNDHLVHIGISFKIGIVGDIIFRCIGPSRKGWRLSIPVGIACIAIFVISATAAVEIIYDRIPHGGVFRMIFQGGKNPAGPVRPKLPAVMNYIRKRKGNKGRNSQDKRQEIPVLSHHFFHNEVLLPPS